MSPVNARAARALRAAGVAAFCALASGCGLLFGDEDPLDLGFGDPGTALAYEPELIGAPSDEIAALAEQSLSLWRRQEDGAQSVALLRRRAEADIEILQKILRSEGYFQARVEREVIAPQEAAPQSEASANANPQSERVTGKARAILRIDPGPAFTLVAHEFRIEGEAPAAALPEPSALGAPVGARAQAAPILAAESEAQSFLRNNGQPWARSTGRRSVADLEQSSLSVTSTLEPGPQAQFGPLRFEGLDKVRARYLRTYQGWAEGAPFSHEQLETFQRDLLATDLFRLASVRIPEEPPEAAPEDGGPHSVPILVEIEERKPRTVSAGLRYDTDNGIEARLGFVHRNLFGENEQLDLRFDAGMLEQRFTASYREPQFAQPGQDLTAGFSARHIEDEAYDETGATLTVGLEREVTEHWIIGLGGLLEAARVTDLSGDADVFLAGVPGFARFDNTNDQLDPSKGSRWLFQLTPFAGLLDADTTTFLTADLSGSAYQALDEEGRYVIAGRARAASILSSRFEDVPANRRLYAGGGGSVRGFADRHVGPLDSDGDPIGGRSAAEIGAELRARLYGDFGAAAFVDAGAVSPQLLAFSNSDFLAAYGVGFRYYSPIGPIRFDVALPMNPRPSDDDFQFYFSIGQAF
ncbi:MAG: BamA/TamA family outer membrane protein [Neomegalonema sp.]|nr:BamA/TamA family outer membrane protein [Neomegalonema sp.]